MDSFFAALSAVDVGLSMAERMGAWANKIIPSFFYKNDYYFKEVNKKVYIRKNGNGFVVSSCELYVIRPEKVDNFIRTFDISDAKKNSRFPRFKQMQRKNFNSFEDYAFFWESDIITSVAECDNKKLTPAELRKKNEGKLLAVEFIVDRSKLKAKNSYKLLYGYSAPGLFPIKDGKHDVSEYSEEEYGHYSSSLDVKHTAKKSRISVYLEKGIKLRCPPEGDAIRVTDSQTVPPKKCDSWNNILYTKYTHEVKRPEKYSAVQVKWKLK